MATIGDVARAAGVSRSSASYALSGKRAISEEVRLRVEAAVKELGYTPNAGARALATSQTRVIGLLAQFLPDEFAPAMLQYIMGVSNTALELGYDTLLVSDEDHEGALQRITRSHMVDGVVLLNVAAHDDRLPILRAGNHPGVLVGVPDDCSGVDVFDLDFEEAGRMMVEHLYRLGHTSAILFSQPAHVVERGGAYVWRLRDAALAQARFRGMRLQAVFGSSQQPEIGREINSLLDAHPDATGLLLNNEAAAAALPSVLHERGLRSPHDISVLGRYSEDFARTFALPFSFIESSPDRLGQMAVRQLVRRIEDPSARSEPHVVRLLTPQVVDRGSTGPAPRPGGTDIFSGHA